MFLYLTKTLVNANPVAQKERNVERKPDRCGIPRPVTSTISIDYAFYRPEEPYRCNLPSELDPLGKSLKARFLQDLKDSAGVSKNLRDSARFCMIFQDSTRFSKI